MKRYLARQAEHHRKVSHRDELKTLLRRAGIEYDERYLDWRRHPSGMRIMFRSVSGGVAAPATSCQPFGQFALGRFSRVGSAIL